MPQKISASLKGIIFFVFFLLLCLTPITTEAQTPTPLPTSSAVSATPSSAISQEEIIGFIEEDAKRHARMNSPSRETTVKYYLATYSRTVPDLNERELQKVYDNAYISKKQEPEPLPSYIPKELQQYGPWILGLVAILIAFFKERMNKALNSLFDWLSGLLYKSFAGNRLFRGKALQCYRESIFERYEQITVPFRTKKLEMRDIYIPLKVAGEDEKQQFDAFQAISDSRRLMIVGAPGSGKSMLLRYLVLAYADGRLLSLPDRPIPILLPLNKLNASDKSLFDIIVQEFEANKFPRANEFVEKAMKQGTLMLLLDGLDEVDTTQRSDVVRQIMELADNQQYSKCRLLITCRSAVYHGEFDALADRKLEILEFSDQQIQGFLRSWEEDMRQSEKAKSPEQLMKNLRERPPILRMARNPLLLTIIAYLYTDTDFELPRSRADFYKRAIDHLLELRDQRNNLANRFVGRDKRIVLEHLGLYFQDNASEQEDSRTLDVETIIAQIRLKLPGVGRKEEDAPTILDEIVERSGLLLALDGNSRYAFAHLTLQEFFAAAELEKAPDELLRRFKAKPDRWVEVVKLWCGITNNSTYIIQHLYQSYPLIAFECLADAGEVNKATVDEILGTFKKRLGEPTDTEAINRAFAAVAADSRPRGKEVFNFLVETFQKDKNLARRNAAIVALSLTNQPGAAEVLMTQAENNQPVRNALVHMGDLAVPYVASFAEKQQLWAVDALYTIGTPKAAYALTAHIWNESDHATLASGLLAVLLKQSFIEEALRDYPLTDAQRRIDKLTWVWEPFKEPVPSALPVITGRIALLISRTYPSTPLIPDLRLRIPLFLLRASECSTILQDKEFKEKYFKPQLALRKSEEFWQDILLKLPAPLQLLLHDLPAQHGYQLMQSISQGRLPNREDWRNIFQPIQYKLSTSIHGLTLTLILVVITGTTFWQIGQTIYHSHPLLSITNAVLLVAGIAIIVCLFTLQIAWDDSTIEMLCISFLLWPLGILFLLVPDIGFFIILLGIPIVLCQYFSTMFLLSLFTWPIVVSIWLLIICLGAILYFRGQSLLRRASNPLNGLLNPPIRDDWHDDQWKWKMTKRFRR